jgi:hypothetical protein
VKYEVGVGAVGVCKRPIVAHFSAVAHDKKTGSSLNPGMGSDVQVIPPSVVVYRDGCVLEFGTSPAAMQVLAVGHENP